MCVHLPAKVKELVLAPSVILEINVKEPNMRVAVLILNVKLVPHVAPVQSIFLPRTFLSAVTVRFVVNAQSITTSSCGNGTLEVQFAAVDHVQPLVFNQCCVVDEVKVIHELPPLSPDNQVIADKFHEAAPAPVISRKSA